MIKISQKRVCNDCVSSVFANERCELGYKIKVVYFGYTAVNAIPLEPCPKPKTRKDWLEARKHYTKY